MAALTKRQQFQFWTVAALVATAGLVAILIWEHRPAPRHALYVIGSPEKGAALFFGAKECSICHSVNGTGGRIAPDLAGVHPGTPAMGWLTTVLWNHAPGMWRQLRGRKAPQLNQEEMANILAYLYEASTVDKAGNAGAGQFVFTAKGCAHCHAVGSGGGSIGPDLSKAAAAGDSIAWMGAMWNHAHSMIEPVTREIGVWPQFKGVEMNNLIAYVSAGRAAGPKSDALRGRADRGWDVFQAKCIACHSVRGKGGHIGPELGPDHELPYSTAQFAAVLWNHAPAMLAQVRQAGMANPTLQGDEITDVLKFLISLRYYEPTGSPFLGEKVFAERGCAACHGPKAEGTKQGPKLKANANAFTTVSLATALWSHGPAMRARTEEMGMAWPTLEAGDIGDLISFLNDPSHK